MTVTIHIEAADAEHALLELQRLCFGDASPTITAPVAPQPEPEPAKEEAKPTRARKSKKDEPKAEPAPEPEPEQDDPDVKEEPEPEKSVEAPADAPDLDINDVRGCISLVTACKDITVARGLLSTFDAKKVSDIKKEHYVELVEQTAELLGVEFGPALRGAKVVTLLTKLGDIDEHKALKEKFGGEAALTISDAEFTALEKAARSTSGEAAG